MGASHIERGINTDEYNSAINLASSSERYMFSYLKLKKLINDNPQIDTLFLEFAPTDIQKNTDSKYFQKNEMTHFIPLYSPYFSKEEWNIYSNYKMDILLTLFQNLTSNLPFELSDFGGYKVNEGFFDRNKEPYPNRQWLEVGNYINYSYLDKIVKTCQKNNIELLFLYMPMYNKDYYYDTNYFYKIYIEKFSNIPFLDYSDWDCPDTYRKDEHHLNKKGAIEFTKQLFENL